MKSVTNSTDKRFLEAERKLSNGKIGPRKEETMKNGKTKVIMKGKTYCGCCKKKCSGEVLRVQDKYFHTNCFKCKVCKSSLAKGGFFFKDDHYYCTNDYQKQFGTKCAACGEYVEGEVVSALGNTYHQNCFSCARCGQTFPGGEKVTYTGQEVLCAKCVRTPYRDATARSPSSPASINGDREPPEGACAGCFNTLKEGQALIALDRQWHIWCFKCKACDATLQGEYMGKDGVPYCERDYQKLFGVRCAYCSRFIAGKVLQAGDNHHFHPTCARCTKCGDPFGDGEEMYLQGTAIWHPKCGPGPTENGTVLNSVPGSRCASNNILNGACSDTDREFDGLSCSAVSESHYGLRSRSSSYNESLSSSVCNGYSSKPYSYQRAGSPGLLLREYKTPSRTNDISRICTYSYLTEEPSLGYLKKPIDPYDRPPTSPHFHRPTSAPGLRPSSRASTARSHRSGMRVMVDSIRSEMPPRPKSPHMNNEEPIELAHFPAAKPPPPGEKPKIERDDFPAPPYPYSDPERRKRWSETYKEVSDSEDEDQTDRVKAVKTNGTDKLTKEEKELSKIASGIGKVFLQNVRERERMNKWKQAHVDPRNASRCPSAAREPAYRLRFQSPINASPSRNLDYKSGEEDEFERCSYNSWSMGRSTGAISGYNALPPRPTTTAGLRSSTLPASMRYEPPQSHSHHHHNNTVDYYGGMHYGKTRSTDFSSARSDVSMGSLSDMERGAMSAGEGGPYLRGSMPFGSHFRRSLPNMSASASALHHPAGTGEPPKIYPYHLLMITNYRLPADVDRLNLERHLSNNEFEQLFQCTRADFYRLPLWRRNELKRRARLF